MDDQNREQLPDPSEDPLRRGLDPDNYQRTPRVANPAIGIAVGTGAGVAIGVALENLALGMLWGAAAGLLIGLFMNRKDARK